jgi:hypothetical protein
MQFIPINGPHHTPPGIEVSSTAIRRVMKEKTRDEALEVLEDVALNVELLLEYEWNERNGISRLSAHWDWV